MVKVVRIDLNQYKSNPGERLNRNTLLAVVDQANTSKYALPGPNGYLSPSTIDAWSRCPRKVYYDKFEGDPIRKHKVPLVTGRTVHASLEYIYKKKMDDPYADITAEEILDIVDTNFAKEVEPLLEEWKDETATGNLSSDEIKKISKASTICSQAMQKYVELAPWESMGDILGVEEEILVTVDGIPLYGLVDLHTDSHVIDHKFVQRFGGAVVRRKGMLHRDFQLPIYELALGLPAVIHMVAPPPARPPRTGEPYQVLTVIDRQEGGVYPLDEFIDTIHGIASDIEAGNFRRRGLTYEGCGDCPYKDKCLVSSYNYTSVPISDSEREISVEEVTLTKKPVTGTIQGVLVSEEVGVLAKTFNSPIYKADAKLYMEESTFTTLKSLIGKIPYIILQTLNTLKYKRTPKKDEVWAHLAKDIALHMVRKSATFSVEATQLYNLLKNTEFTFSETKKEILKLPAEEIALRILNFENSSSIKFPSYQYIVNMFTQGGHNEDV